ncbi:sulfite exporter TauE/SafE family protein [Polluticaenibacter yanchengensis]|uniref:Sulfite exporter TauE/SafE family protein n=1 Tax=Polluticaenibacter yanchengensis TaxID=3014562 RepID=A0ABT4UFR2_9BACT|nr:sulfite exporter TauE/SafE family protein [Chitinophagaceae bacterium LY-5]
MVAGDIIAGVIIGLVSSVHCIGMCGPIALSLPVYNESPFKKASLILIYNLGRAFSYACIGLLIGFLGQRFVLWGFQQALSLIAGAAILIIFTFKYWGGKYAASFEKPFFSVKAKLSGLLSGRKNTLSYFLIGVLNGLLPCGMVYVAAGYALALSNPFYSAAFMFLFGLGTLPLMASITILSKNLSFNFRQKLNRIVPFIICITAVCLLLRGMGLGIPYLSPKMEARPQTSHVIGC